jgi:hypothetical protein
LRRASEITCRIEDFTRWGQVLGSAIASEDEFMAVLSLEQFAEKKGAGASTSLSHGSFCVNLKALRKSVDPYRDRGKEENPREFSIFCGTKPAATVLSFRRCAQSLRATWRSRSASGTIRGTTER